MTRILRWSAATISIRTKSSASSMRRLPDTSVARSQLGPIDTIAMSQVATLRLIASTKSSPGEIWSISMKT
jgi:hypothetical protein